MKLIFFYIFGKTFFLQKFSSKKIMKIDITHTAQTLLIFLLRLLICLCRHNQIFLATFFRSHFEIF